METNNLHVCVVGGTSRFMAESWIRGFRNANMTHVLNGGTVQYDLSVICARNGIPAEGSPNMPLELAMRAFGFSEMFDGRAGQVGAQRAQADIIDRIGRGHRGKPFDALWIMTPDRDHGVYVDAGVASGIRQIATEKCLADTYKECDRLVKLAETAQNTEFCYVMYNYRALAAMRYLRGLLAKGIINGQQYKAVVNFLQNWGRTKENRKNWRFNWKLAGLAGVLADLGGHMFDLIAWVLQPMNDEIVSVKNVEIGYYTGDDNDGDFAIHYPGDADFASSGINVKEHAVDCGKGVLVTASNNQIAFETGRHYPKVVENGYTVSKDADLQVGITCTGSTQFDFQWELHRQCDVKIHDANGKHTKHMDAFVSGLGRGFPEGHELQILGMLQDADSGYKGTRIDATCNFETAARAVLIAAAARHSGLNGGAEVTLSDFAKTLV